MLGYAGGVILDGAYTGGADERIGSTSEIFFGWPLEASAPLGPDSVGRFGLRPDGAKGSPALVAGDPLLFGALLCGGS